MALEDQKNRRPFKFAEVITKSIYENEKSPISYDKSGAIYENIATIQAPLVTGQPVLMNDSSTSINDYTVRGVRTDTAANTTADLALVIGTVNAGRGGFSVDPDTYERTGDVVLDGNTEFVLTLTSISAGAKVSYTGATATDENGDVFPVVAVAATGNLGNTTKIALCGGAGTSTAPKKIEVVTIGGR